MPAHDCAFALSIAFAEPLPVEEQVGRVSIYKARANFFGFAGGAVVGVGWDRKRVKTLDALLPEGTVVSILGSLLSDGTEEAVKQARQTLRSPGALCERGLTCCGGLEKTPHALLR